MLIILGSFVAKNPEITEVTDMVDFVRFYGAVRRACPADIGETRRAIRQKSCT